MPADFTEVNTFAAKLGQAGPRTRQAARAAVTKTAHDIVATAQMFVPVDTSATKNSIHAVPVDGGLGADIGPTTHYAPYLEYGTVKMAAHAFMGPALDRHSPDLAQAVRQLAAGELG